MTTYKLFREVDGRLYSLFVDSKREIEIGKWIDATVGELVDEGHVRSRIGPLSLRPGFHSAFIPFIDYLGKRGKDGKLLQRKGTVWTECEVDGEELIVTQRNGLKTIPDGWYRFNTNSKQKVPWIISGRIFVNRILDHEEVVAICKEHNLVAQSLEE